MIDNSFHSHCQSGTVDDELITDLELSITKIINNCEHYFFSYINSSSANLHFQKYKKLESFDVKEIIVLFRSYLIEDATEVETILLNDYKTDPKNINKRNHPKRIIDGGNDEYYVYIVTLKLNE